MLRVNLFHESCEFFFYNTGMWKYISLLVLVLGVFLLSYSNHQKNINRFDDNSNLVGIKDKDFIDPDRTRLYFLKTWHPDRDGDISKMETLIKPMRSRGITDLVIGPLNSQMMADGALNITQGEYNDRIDSIDRRFSSFSVLTEFLFKAKKEKLNTHLAINLNSVHRYSSLASNKEFSYLFRNPTTKCNNNKTYQPKCTGKDAIDFRDEDPQVKDYLYRALKSVWLSKGFKGAFLYQGNFYHQETINYFKKGLDKTEEKYELNLFFEKQNSMIYLNYLKEGLINQLYLFNFSTYLTDFLVGKNKKDVFTKYLETIFKIKSKFLITPLKFVDSKHSTVLREKAWAFTIGLGSNLFLFEDINLDKYEKYFKLYLKYQKRFKGFLKVLKIENSNVFCYSKNDTVDRKPILKSITCINLSDSSQELVVEALHKSWKKGFFDILTNKKFSTKDKVDTLLPHESRIYIELD